MRKIYAFILAVMLLATPAMMAQKKTIHTIGDSTQQECDDSTPQKGWPQMFGQFFDETISINNRGKSGASSKSFYKESAYWASVKKQISEGDYVIIQFAHNDEKNGGMDGDSVRAKTGDTSVDYRGTTPYGTYKDYLRAYVNESRELGATPLLVGPICRRYFNGNSIKRNGWHDLGDSYSILKADGTITTGNKVPADDNTMDYVYAMKQVAEEMNVPFIDLTTKSAELYLSYGETDCVNLLFKEPGDGTHTNALGAQLLARIVAEEMKAQNILAEHIVLDAAFTVSATNLDLGKAYIGQVVERELNVSAYAITPENGNVTVTATEGFILSTDKVNYSSTLSLPYQGGNLAYTHIYVRANVSAGGVNTGTISLTAGERHQEVAVSYEGVNLAGGAEVTLQWKLEKDDSYTLSGPAIAVAQTHSQMYVQKYSSPNANTVWPEGCGFVNGQKTQRNLIVGDAWPAGEIDEVSTRYIQFGITAAENTILHIDSIGLYVCGCGGNGMRSRISYSTDENFGNAKMVAEFTSAMPANNMLIVSATPVVELAAGETLLLRVYPWYNGAATGKTICLSHVTIHGVAEAVGEGSAIDAATATEATPIEVLYYNVCGTQLDAAPESGLYFEKTLYNDGSVSVEKVIK